MFKEYFGALTPDTTEQDELKKEISTAKEENSNLKKELEDVNNEISALREKITKATE